MSSDRQGLDPTRFMPAPVEERLIALLARGAGALLVLLVIAIWASLLTWAVTDPSLTHSTGGNVRNAMGPIGAIVSDLLLQTLGFAAAVATLAPMIWSIELLSGDRVWNLRTKAALVPLSVLMLAGALSSLPTPAAWPLHHGMGGMIGDIMLKLASSVFGVVNASQSGLASGMLLAAIGFSTLIHSLGLDLSDLRDLLPAFPDFKRYARRGDDASSWHQNLKAEANRLRERLQPAAQVAALDPGTHDAPDVSDTQHLYYADDETDTAAWMESRKEPSFDGIGETGHTYDAPQRKRAPTQTAMQSLWSRPVKDDQGEDADDADENFDEDIDVRAGFAAAASREHVRSQSSQSMARRFAATPAAEDSPAAPAKAALRKPAFLQDWRPRNVEPAYKRPPIALLKRAAPSRAGAELSQTALRGTARLLEDVLVDFGIKGEMRDVRPGPVVTLFEFEPARGTKTSRIVALADDIARSMSVTSVRVAVVPGRSVIGIELPNVKRETVMLRDMFEADAYQTSEALLPIVLGRSIGGDAIVADLARMPHLLVAGTTGSGKSVGVNAMILSLLYRLSPQQCRMLLIDPKMLELSVYNGIPHLLTPVVTDPSKAVMALNWAVGEMDERYKRMSKLSVRNIDAFNGRLKDANKRGEQISRTVQTGFDRRTGAAVYESEDMDLEPMPYIVIVVDEFADLMTVAGKEIEVAVQRLAQMARAAGIHLIMATQRPSVDIITGTIKANFPTRISFKVTSKIDSRTILNEQGAEQLLGAGDMLYSSGSGQIVRVHGPFVSDQEVEAVAEKLRAQGEPEYVDDIFDAGPRQAAEGGQQSGNQSHDDLYDRAVALVMRDQKASTSYIQRRLQIGYNRAADLMERMEEEGLISAPSHSGKREILGGHG